MESSAATLVFPAINQLALNYLAEAKARDEKTICAASVSADDVALDWGTVHHLPTIYESSFLVEFIALVNTHGIRRLYCPVAAVHDFIRHLIVRERLALVLLGESPIRQQVQAHQQLIARTRRLLPLIAACANGSEALSELEAAGVLRQSSLIYGESNDDKLAALMGVFSNAPRGDVVEIGSLMGRSAFVLLYLAGRFDIGNVLTVDPWTSEQALQHDSPGSFQTLVDHWDFEVLSEGFQINMLPFSRGQHAHLRQPSQAAHAYYQAHSPIVDYRGAQVPYTGQIAVIHIDGNHDYAQVSEDCRLWLPHLGKGSWLILDDYIWSHGDGPYRVGNDLLRDKAEQISCAFTCGKALFVQFRW